MRPILVFDVIETILDITHLAPVFEQIFGDRALLRTWFDEVVVYSEALTITGSYADGGKVGAAVLDMLAATRGVSIGPADLDAFKRASAALPAYPDVAPGLQRLRRAGYRLVTLSNSPVAASETQLGQAGIRTPFERLFSVDERVKRFKPARIAYEDVATALGVRPAELCLVSCHAFDVMGAAAAGLRTAMICRPGNAPFAIGSQPDVIVDDVVALAAALPAKVG